MLCGQGICRFRQPRRSGLSRSYVPQRLSSVNRRSNVGRDGRGNGIDIGVRQKMEQPACQGSAKP